MNSGVEVLLLAMMLILPLSALVTRRVPFGKMVKLALLWIMIFAAATAGILLWNDGRMSG